MQLSKNVLQLNDYLIKTRRELHQIPELCYKEFKTSEYIQKALKSFKISFKTAGTGVVAEIKGNDTSKTIGLRADMDGLSIEEKTNHSFKSVHSGCMHACGHDAHMAMLLGVAKVLSQNKPKYNVKLLFQPAEEGGLGAQKMLESGLIESDVFYALHVDPFLPVGVFSTRAGATMAGASVFSVSFLGKSKHVGRRNGKEDAILAMATFITKAERIKKRECIFNCGIINGGEGDKANVVAENSQGTFTIRFLNNKHYEKLKTKLNRLLNKISLQMKVEYETKEIVYVPALYNTPEVANNLLKNPNFITAKKRLSSEDMSILINAYSGALIWVGCMPDSGEKNALHSSKFNLNEKALTCGVQFFTDLVKQV